MQQDWHKAKEGEPSKKGVVLNQDFPPLKDKDREGFGCVDTSFIYLVIQQFLIWARPGVGTRKGRQTRK